MMTNNFCSITLFQLLYDEIWFSQNLSQVYKQYPFSIYFIICCLYEIRSTYIYIWYCRPSIIDLIHFSIKVNLSFPVWVEADWHAPRALLFLGLFCVVGSIVCVLTRWFVMLEKRLLLTVAAGLSFIAGINSINLFYTVSVIPCTKIPTCIYSKNLKCIKLYLFYIYFGSLEQRKIMNCIGFRLDYLICIIKLWMGSVCIRRNINKPVKIIPKNNLLNNILFWQCVTVMYNDVHLQ